MLAAPDMPDSPMRFFPWGPYERLVLDRPVLTLVLVALLLAFFGWHARDFRLDASADTLVLEGDADLRYYRAISGRYDSDDYLVITYTPRDDLFSDAVLADLAALRDKLKGIERVDAVLTILDVPLIDSPRMTLSEVAEEIRTLETPGMDRELARRELTTSPFYSNLIINPQARTTAIQVTFQRDQRYQALFKRRNDLRAQRLESELTPAEHAELAQVSAEFKAWSDALLEQEAADIERIRAIMDEHRDMARLHLGGVPMIVADSMDYVRKDLATFGIAVLALLVTFLLIAFRKPRWVILSMLTCAAAALFMLGYLGLSGWRVTVVSSNFVSLLLIITMSLTVHLIVRYRELHHAHPERDQRTLVSDMLRSKFSPSLYTALTTQVAFASLIVSDIRPVIDFGWMMVIGIGAAFVLAFTLFPAALMLWRPGTPSHLRDITGHITLAFAHLIERYRAATLTGVVLLAAAGIYGVTQLTVENRFIDYFKKDTEIYRGMELIDTELGGTTPLEVIIDAPQRFLDSLVEEPADSYMDRYAEDVGITGSSFWFNTFMLKEVRAIHDYLDDLPETGKVLSIDTAMRMLTILNEGDEFNDFFLSILYKRLPQSIKDALFAPYLSPDGNQLRFSIRVFESDYSLKRKELIEKIRTHLVDEMGLEPGQVHLTGMVVLYNNMLQSLFRSQIMTIGVVFLAILGMFVILFRNLRMALVAIVPNMLSATLVLGLMGLAGIPLDIMTITIAAICIGIAVDDTIHYVHRFSEEFTTDGDYWKAILRSHNSIGRAMYYTSVIITVGFSILALSNFIPTIYFGLLTGFSMVVALVANLTLLALLIAIFKPLGREPSAA